MESSGSPGRRKVAASDLYCTLTCPCSGGLLWSGVSLWWQAFRATRLRMVVRIGASRAAVRIVFFAAGHTWRQRLPCATTSAPAEWLSCGALFEMHCGFWPIGMSIGLDLLAAVLAGGSTHPRMSESSDIASCTTEHGPQCPRSAKRGCSAPLPGEAVEL